MGTNRSDKVITEILGEEIAITPSELVSRVIKKQAVGGYDTHEVDDLLEQTAETLEKLVGRLRELKAVNEEHRAQLVEYREIEGSLRNALVSSQKFGDEIVEQAKREADLIRTEARLQHDEARAEAARLPEAITREIRLLLEERDRIRDDILAVLDAHRLWVEMRVPERDSALSERLLAFVNSRQGIAPHEARAEAQAASANSAPEEAPSQDTESPAIHPIEDEDDHALPDVVLGLEPAPEEATHAADCDGEVLEAVADDDATTSVKEPTA